MFIVAALVEYKRQHLPKGWGNVGASEMKPLFMVGLLAGSVWQRP